MNEPGKKLPRKELARKALEELRKRLLDKTSRNKLLKFNVSNKTSLRIIDELPDQLVELLLSDQELRFLPIPVPTREELIKHEYIEIDKESGEEIVLKDDPSAEEWAGILGLNASYELPWESSPNNSEKHQDNAIQTLFYPNELETRLKKFSQTSNLAIQEMGANILYLVFGFLEWHEYGDEKKRLAPLFLIPIRLEKGRLNKATNAYEYTLQYSGGEIVTNISLREKLREDFGLKLPDLDQATRPEQYFKDVSKVIRPNPAWSVRRYASLALLNFSKMMMYLDLDPTNWPEGHDILEHPLMMKFLAGYSQADEDLEDGYDDYGFGEEHPIDNLKDVHSKYPLIDDADSSQHSALVDAINGKNLVIEGPPGTGKSQTITNLIAALIAQGKKVLFVAEKLAALEVVKRRLDRANLGDFCLELHSHKSQKQKVLEELGTRLEKQGYYRRASNIDVCIDGYEKQKKQLNKHAELINTKWKSTGKSSHEILMSAARFRMETSIDPSVLHLEGYNGENLTRTVQRQTTDLVETYRKIYQSVVDRLPSDAKEITAHPWHGVQNSDIQLLDRGKIFAALEEWQESLDELQESGRSVAEILQIAPGDIFTSLGDLEQLAVEINSLPTLTGDEWLPSLPRLEGGELDRAKKYLDLNLAIKKKYKDLSSEVKTEVLQNLSVVGQWSSVIEEIQASLTTDLSVSELVDAIADLANTRRVLEENRGALEHFAANLPLNAQKTLIGTVTGFRNFVLMLRSVASLDSAVWRLRDKIFDNEELDELLPALGAITEELRISRTDLDSYFVMGQIPDYPSVTSQIATLKKTGLFKTLSSDWRAARKAVRGYSKDPKVKVSILNEVLPKLAKFIKGRDDLDKQEKYKQALGDKLKSIDTNVDELNTMRDWYKKIREEYGIGTGAKVELGAAILEMSDDLGRTARALVDQNICSKLEEAIGKFEELGKVFKQVDKLQTESVPVVGGSESIKKLLDQTLTALSTVRPLIGDEGQSIAFYRKLVDDLQQYKEATERWASFAVGEKVFEGKLTLDVDASEGSDLSLKTLKSTLVLAESINKLKPDSIAAAILKSPEESLFRQLSEAGQRLEVSVKREDESENKFVDMVHLDCDKWVGWSFREQPLKVLEFRNKHALEDIESLSTWLEYLRCRAELVEEGLEKIVANVESGKLAVAEVEDAHRASMFDLLSREIFEEERGLSRFSGKIQGTVQEKLKEYDEELKLLQRRELASRAAKVEIPRGNYGARVTDHTDRNLIEHEVTKKKRHIPIRQLMNRAGSAIAAMKPCYMMGPMSVAQYLKPGQVEFDVVIMDEASQIKPEDALGAIARAKQLVVVGDPNQLPPTSFFDRINQDEEADVASIQESESILDATLPMFAKRRLRWHYRSQHESLIAFSNHFFYGDDLVVFPSPYSDTKEFGVKRTYLPDGVFVNRRNMVEANEVAEAVRRHLLESEDDSIGVVAMNTQQREQIEAAIEMLSKEDEHFRQHLEKNATSIEPLFVKNLENVQGDERDVVVISMTYGPQEPGGKVAQRFGPINTDVGWRRLNVLFTRSKKRMHIFTSMTTDDIVVGAEAKRGVTALRDFLSFCETKILAKTNIFSGKEPDSDFEIAVMGALARQGFECQPQVGVAGYFIDLAVKDPNKPGRFLMGVECDGATYHSAKSARDRDRLRQTILERLGWRMRRIWSTDWFNNPDAELQSIVNELKELAASSKDESDLELDEEQIEEGIELEVRAGDEETVVPIREIIENEVGIRDGLEWLAAKIREECPNTPSDSRLLRPAMIEAIVKYEPTNGSEFLQVIPEYLREKISSEEGHYLNKVFEIVNGSLAIEELMFEADYEDDQLISSANSRNENGESHQPATSIEDEQPDVESTFESPVHERFQEKQHTGVDETSSSSNKAARSDREEGSRESFLGSSVLKVIRRRLKARAAPAHVSGGVHPGAPVAHIAAKLALQKLRERIWDETGTEPDKYGILKRNLIRKYVESPFSTYAEWEAIVGDEVEAIHESHKSYIPEIVEILSNVSSS